MSIVAYTLDGKRHDFHGLCDKVDFSDKYYTIFQAEKYNENEDKTYYRTLSLIPNDQIYKIDVEDELFEIGEVFQNKFVN